MNNFLNSLTSEDLLLTVNRRLAGYLKNRFDHLKQESGCKTWQSLSILPLFTWVEKVWERYSDHSLLLLNQHQEHVLWEKIISATSADILLKSTETTSLVMETWRLTQEWEIDNTILQNSHIKDVITFSNWSKTFQDHCRRNQWLSRAALLKLLLDLKPSIPFKSFLPSRVVLVGFDNLSPLINKLVTVLKQYCHVEFWTPHKKASYLNRASFHDQTLEFSTMAKWAFTEVSKNKECSIGCVVPNLSKLKRGLEQCFTDTFYDFKMEDHFNELPFNISAPNYLIDYPVIHAAFLCLKMNAPIMKIEELSCLLRSPFLGGAESELFARPLLDSYIRSFGESKIMLTNLQTFVRQNEKSFLTSCQNWWANLHKFLNRIVNKPQSFGEWALQFNEQLISLGWPGQRSPNSQEYQQIQKWYSVLEIFSSLDSVLPPQPFDQAFYYLEQLAKQITFQPKTSPAPIQILGLLESAGILFDKLWITGLDSETWPSAANPNPFIPFDLQKKLNMPHATSDRELEFSQIVTQRFKQSSEEVIFSYSEYSEDRPLSPSPLILDLPEKSPKVLEIIERETKIFITRDLEYFIDHQGPALINKVAGGSNIFKTQSLCPFRAFAEIRLKANGLDFPVGGLALHERGTVIHHALALIWQKIKTHHQLCEMLESELQDIINDAIEQALSQIKLLVPLSLKPRFLKIEKQRLQQLISNWLQYEKERPPFSVIACEQRLNTIIENIEVHFQVDRIDQTDQGHYLILDYKTGKTSIHDWFGERPEEPQLPLYCLASDKKISGIAFAEVRSDSMSFKGIAESSNLLSGALSSEGLNWAQIQSQWQQNLSQLAVNFRSGDARVDPKDSGKTCQYCQLQGFCRIGGEH